MQLQKHFEDIGATITTIDPAKQYLMVNFNLQSYTLIAVYDPQTQSILGMGIVVNGVTNPIRNFKFSFLTASQADKQLLRTDPKTYFLQFDPLLVQKLEL